jgi:VIT1/CCC1 family predicted Fe2+/Mn2+ transporter
LSGVTSMFAFAAGALTPLLPYLLSAPRLASMLALATAALVAGGMATGRMTGRSAWHAGLRQLAFGTGAMAVAYLAGALISGRAT